MFFHRNSEGFYRFHDLPTYKCRIFTIWRRSPEADFCKASLTKRKDREVFDSRAPVWAPVSIVAESYLSGSRVPVQA